MADRTAEIETLENQYMRAWAQADLPTLKSLTASGFHLLVGSKPAAMLDRASWLDAATRRYVCSSYRFGDVYVREVGSAALFASQLDLKASLDGRDWSGRMWVTDLWRKGRIRRRWRLVERVLSRVEEDPEVPTAIKSMQLWR
jgi:ketosteroid isomerase-like protein